MLANTLTYLAIVAGGLLLGFAIRRTVERFYFRCRITQRLMGLRLIAAFELCLGVVYVFLASLLTYSVITRHEDLTRKLNQFQTSPEHLLGEVISLAILTLAAGVGLWRESAGGWNLAAFAITIGVARNILSIALAQHIAPQFGLPLTFYLAQHSVRIAIAAVFLAYLFRSRVMHYCGIAPNRFHHVKSLFAAVVSALGLEILLRMI